MAKQRVAQQSMTMTDEAIEDLALAQATATELFKAADPALIFEVFDALVSDGASPDERTHDIREAYALAKELFGVEQPTPEMVFGVFERVFAEEG